MDPGPAPSDDTAVGVVCPKCLLANSEDAAFCQDCGAPIGKFVNINPIQIIYAQGYTFRSAVDGPPSLIILVGIWIIFAPVVLAAPFLLPATRDSFKDWAELAFWTMIAVFVLYRATRNYVQRTRAVKDREEEEPSGEISNPG